jgi:hypothetical protein
MTARFFAATILTAGVFSVSACWPWSHKYRDLAPLPAGTVVCANSTQLDDRAPFVVDLRLHQANHTPDLGDFIKIEDAGGRVLHAFNVPVIRTRIDGDGLATLLNGNPPFADVAYVVTDTSVAGPTPAAVTASGAACGR